jgi:hypothetical protein
MTFSLSRVLHSNALVNCVLDRRAIPPRRVLSPLNVQTPCKIFFLCCVFARFVLVSVSELTMRLTTPRARRFHPLSYRVYKKISDMGATKIYIYIYIYTHIHTHTHTHTSTWEDTARVLITRCVRVETCSSDPDFWLDFKYRISKIAFGAQQYERRSDEPVRRHTGSTFADPRVLLSFPDNAIVPLEARRTDLETRRGRWPISRRHCDTISRFSVLPLSSVHRHFTILVIDYTWHARAWWVRKLCPDRPRRLSKSSDIEERCYKVRLNHGFLSRRHRTVSSRKRSARKKSADDLCSSEIGIERIERGCSPNESRIYRINRRSDQPIREDYWYSVSKEFLYNSILINRRYDLRI